MIRVPCLYSIVRFCPMVETEEFANVGVVLVAPEHGIFEFKLMTKKHARVTNFFDQLEANVFKRSIANLKHELERIRDILGLADAEPARVNADLARAMFHELIRPRETVFKFSNVRGVLATDPKKHVNELYGHYVDRDFVTAEYREQVLERTLRTWLTEAGQAGRFERLEIGNDEYHATFPFVEERDGRYLMAMKPLNLAQDEPNRIMDHGGAWVWRMAQLKRRNFLPNQVLMTVEGPVDDATPARKRAFADVVGQLTECGATVIDHGKKNDILRFIAAA